MKRFLTLICLGLLTAACASDVVENRETRVTLYKGQSTWDMYENFGAPSYAVRVSPEETHFVYRREEVTRDWSKMYFDWCDMVVVTVDGYVTDWDLAGNQCYLKEAEPADPEAEYEDRSNVMDRYSRERSAVAPAPADGYEDAIVIGDWDGEAIVAGDWDEEAIVLDD